MFGNHPELGTSTCANGFPTRLWKVSPAKVLWVKKHEPKVYARIAQVIMPKDYVRFKLTGAMATEVSDAAGTLYFRCEKPQMVQRDSRKAGHSIGLVPPGCGIAGGFAAT